MESSVRIEEIAADWLARRDSGEWSAADEVELTRWLQASTAHWAAYVRLQAAWRAANRLKALGAGGLPGTLPPRVAPKFMRFFGRLERGHVPSDERKWSGYRRALAVVAMIVMAAGIWWGRVAYFTQTTYSTPIGGTAAIPLPDGSKVTLNTNSQIGVAVGKAERRVSLVQGEAFFDVAKDPTRPFIVVAGARRVIAVGTQFSVRRDGDDVQVIVTEGRVRVEGGGMRQSEALLRAGAVGHSHGSRMTVEQRPAREAEDFLKWRTGFVVFNDIPLAEAVTEFNRYTERQITIQDPSIATIRIGGNFRTGNVEAFLRILQSDFPIRVIRSETGIVLARGDG